MAGRSGETATSLTEGDGVALDTVSVTKSQCQYLNDSIE